MPVVAVALFPELLAKLRMAGVLMNYSESDCGHDAAGYLHRIWGVLHEAWRGRSESLAQAVRSILMCPGGASGRLPLNDDCQS